MKKTETVFILDRSGSMAGLESDTIGGYNSILNKQKESGETVNVTTVLFDDRYELLYDRTDIRKVKPLTEKEYFVRGTTALVDAIGRTVSRFKGQASDSKVVVIITTDGYENASREYDISQVRKMIEQQKEKGWEFIFMGANIDAVSTGSSFGIARNVNFHHDSQGVQMAYRSMAKAVESFILNGRVDESWDREVNEDYNSRR